MFAITTIADTIPIIRQNENGPCFIIALVNAILLTQLTSPDGTDGFLKTKEFASLLLEERKRNNQYLVSLETLNSFIISCVFDDVSLSNAEIIDTLPLLNTGLSINPSFDHSIVEDFGNHGDVVIKILRFFKLNVYHGFIMDDELLKKLSYEKIAPNFDSCQDFLVTNLENIDNSQLVNDINTFLTRNQTELTSNGCYKLMESINENQICIFFRNDHFNTCLKHNNKIYLLVTDIGYIQQPDIVWTPLDISDEVDFFNFNFDKSEIKITPEKDCDPVQKEQESSDMLLARQLQLEEDERLSKAIHESYTKEDKHRPKHNPVSNEHVSKSSQAHKTSKSRQISSKSNKIPQSTINTANKTRKQSKSPSKSSDNVCVIS